MTKHDPGIADSLGPSQLEVLHKKYRAACEEAQAERDVSVDLCQQLAAAEARAERMEKDAARWKENARFWYAQRDDLRDAIKRAAGKLPHWPDTAYSILSSVLEETNARTALKESE